MNFRIKHSIIIPTLNQSQKLKQCLSCLSELFFDANIFEVLVIDNGSTDNSKEITLEFKNKINNLRYIFCKSPGLMAARHRGSDESQGEILCYIDDDSLVNKDWLQGIDDAFSNEEVVLVGGPCIPEYEESPLDWVEYFWRYTKDGKINTFLSLLDFGANKLSIDPHYVYGCNFSIRKRKFYELGGTNPDYLPERYKQFQGDGEVGLKSKIISSGYKTLYDPRVKIRHIIPSSRLTVEYFCKRAYFNGIHTSYSEVRKQKGVKKSFLRKSVLIMRKRMRNIKDIILSDEPKEIRKIKQKVKKSFMQGFAFHQKEVMNDPNVLEWVLRDNYFRENGKIPE